MRKAGCGIPHRMRDAALKNALPKPGARAHLPAMSAAGAKAERL
jgi:hypothetical protein